MEKGGLIVLENTSLEILVSRREGYSPVRLFLAEDGTLVDAGYCGDRLPEGVVVERVVVTHGHPDHWGGCRVLQDSGAEVLAPEEDLWMIRDYAAYLEWTVDEIEWAVGRSLPELRSRVLEAADACDPPDPKPLASDLGWARVVPAPGHTRGSVVLDLGELLLTADTLLEPGTYLDDVGAYLGTLGALEARKAVPAMPSHGSVIRGVDKAAAKARRRVVGRLGQILSAARDWTGALGLLESLYGSMGEGRQAYMRLRQLAAYIRFLVGRGFLERRERGEGGAALYRRTVDRLGDLR